MNKLLLPVLNDVPQLVFSGSNDQLADCNGNSTKWTCWIGKSSRKASVAEFTSSLRRVYRVSSMHVLTAICSSGTPVCKLANRYSYHFMLGDRRPVWEDPENCKGGAWTFRCRKTDTEFVWRSLLEAMVTGRLKHCLANGDCLIGMSAGTRELEDVVHLWNMNAEIASQATLIDFVVAFLPRITFGNAIYKPFREKEASFASQDKENIVPSVIQPNSVADGSYAAREQKKINSPASRFKSDKIEDPTKPLDVNMRNGIVTTKEQKNEVIQLKYTRKQLLTIPENSF